jgi:hypothetical protein
MSRIVSRRETAEALRKTLRHLESDPSIDSRDPAFLNLKHVLLDRITDCEMKTAETGAVQSRESVPTEATLGSKVNGRAA